MKAIKCLLLCLALLCGAAVLGAQEFGLHWAISAGGIFDDESQDIAIDSQGNQYITGTFMGTATFGTHTLTANGNIHGDIFVAKLDPDGNWLWAVKAEGWIYRDCGYGIAVDSSGNAYLTGSFEGTATFGDHTLTASGNLDIFVAKLDSAGNWLWAAKAGGIKNDEGRSIAVDGMGNTYVTGYFRVTATFGSHSLTATASSSSHDDFFVAKLDPDGNWLWAVRAEGSFINFYVGYSAHGINIVVDGSGNAWVTGDFKGIATFGSQTLTSSYNCESCDIFVARLDPDGNWLWAVQAGRKDLGYDIAVDGSGNAWVTGTILGLVTFGSQTLSQGVYVAKLDPDGNWLWAVDIRTISLFPDVYKIALDAAGNAYVAGHFFEYACFANHCIDSSGDFDIYVAKLDPDGNWFWKVNLGIFPKMLRGFALDSEGHLYMSGYYSFMADFFGHSLQANGDERKTDIFVTRLGNVASVDDVPAARLHGAYPNPLYGGGSAVIKVDIEKCKYGTLSIFNLRGQLLSRQRLSKGSHEISFSGKGLPAGIYLYSIRCGNYQETKKLVLIK